MRSTRAILCCLLLATAFTAAMRADGPGILLLAHGGSAEWNAHVTTLAGQVNQSKPTEVAFGMATRASLQAAVDRLRARGVTDIVAVPLFVSSWSSVITSTEYLLGQRAVAPPELEIYAKMSHTPPAPSAAAAPEHAAHADDQVAQAKVPVTASVPIRMTSALNDHPVVADILASRARSISRNPGSEAVIVVAHGPSRDEENQRWLTDMASLAARIGRTEPYGSIDYLTLRDDAPKPIRDQATAELRAIVTKRLNEGKSVLIVPLLVSFGGIERGLRERLDGLPYTMPDAALVPDQRLVSWVLAVSETR